MLDANPPVDVACSYTSVTRTSERPEEVRTERYAAGIGPELLAINGEAPSPKALAKYEKERRGREEARRGPEEMDFADLIQEESVTVVGENDDTLTFAFTPKGDDQDEEMLAKLNGRLTVAKAGYRPLRLAMALDEAISPAPTVKMHEFRQEMTFTQDPTTDATLIDSMSFAVRGKAFVFKKIDSEGHIDFKDFDCEAVATPEPQVDNEG